MDVVGNWLQNNNSPIGVRAVAGGGGGSKGGGAVAPSCFEKVSGKTLMIRATAVEINVKKKEEKKTTVILKRQAK